MKIIGLEVHASSLPKEHFDVFAKIKQNYSSDALKLFT